MDNSARTFDRIHDISKIDGCNTRGIEYRWQIFSKEIATIPVGGEALDFAPANLMSNEILRESGAE
jgi:hypothetical protein